MVEKFEFDSKLKKNLYIMMGVGVLGLVWAFFSNGVHGTHSRFWSNILLNAYYFTGIGIFGIFFVSASQLGYAGWITLVKRIFLSLSGFIKIGAIFALLIIGGVWLGYHHLYHWAEPGYLATIKYSNTKQIFFNPTFWTVRMVIYFVLWIFVGNAVIKAINAKNIGDEKDRYFCSFRVFRQLGYDHEHGCSLVFYTFRLVQFCQLWLRGFCLYDIADHLPEIKGLPPAGQ
jgi:hypothetical protein